MHRHHRTLRGFTLIELMISIVILGILASMAAVTYFGIFSKGQDVAAQDALHGLSVEQRSYFSTYGSFTNNVSTLEGIEPNYTFATAASTGPTSISVGTGTISGTPAVGMAVLGASGYCNTINVLDPTQSRQDLTGRFRPSASTPCTGTYALSNTTPTHGW
jgi:prepilin-type N-terminal cleavage/methylation domain-containing protein